MHFRGALVRRTTLVQTYRSQTTMPLESGQLAAVLHTAMYTIVVSVDRMVSDMLEVLLRSF